MVIFEGKRYEDERPAAAMLALFEDFIPLLRARVGEFKVTAANAAERLAWARTKKDHSIELFSSLVGADDDAELIAVVEAEPLDDLAGLLFWIAAALDFFEAFEDEVAGAAPDFPDFLDHETLLDLGAAGFRRFMDLEIRPR